MVTDNASPKVISQSQPWLFDHARLYFRPRTPTFWRNEGIRPAGFRSYGAHCPVPVALMFDAKAVSGRQGVRFSDGNLASRWATHGKDVAFLRSLDFREIHHEGPMGPEDTQRLRARRQAEIFVPGELSLDDLRFVVARSEAEHVTLLSLLADTAWIHSPLIDSVLADPNLFYCRWTFIEHVALLGDHVRFLFNPDTETPGPFDARFVWTNPRTGASESVYAPLRGAGQVTAPVPDGFRNSVVELTVFLDEALAFAGSLESVPSSALLIPR